MLVSVANCLLARPFLTDPKRLKLLGAILSWTCHWLWCCNWEVLNYNPQSQLYTQWIPSLYHLFGPSKKYLAGKQFATGDDVKQTLPHGYRHLTPIHLMPGCKPWCHIWTCLSVNDDCMEVWCVPSATHVPCMLWHQNNVLSIRMLMHYLIQQTAHSIINNHLSLMSLPYVLFQPLQGHHRGGNIQRYKSITNSVQNVCVLLNTILSIKIAKKF
jgi:hypothetical protein